MYILYLQNLDSNADILMAGFFSGKDLVSDLETVKRINVLWSNNLPCESVITYKIS